MNDDEARLYKNIINSRGLLTALRKRMIAYGGWQAHLRDWLANVDWDDRWLRCEYADTTCQLIPSDSGAKILLYGVVNRGMQPFTRGGFSRAALRKLERDKLIVRVEDRYQVTDLGRKALANWFEQAKTRHTKTAKRSRL
jgi:hypothetical protein